MFNKCKRNIKEKMLDLSFENAINVAASMCNHETFSPIKACNKGKEIAICGGGPTLNEYIPMEGVLHIALNRALLCKNIKYDWFIADDWDGVDFYKDELKNYDCKKFFGHQIGGDISREIPESYRIDCNAFRYYTDSYHHINGYQSKFVCDIDRMAIGNMPNIALSAMQIALFTYPQRIYLVGCDASSSGHFVQPSTLNEERIKIHEKDLKMAVSGDKVIEKWIELKEFANAFYPDVEIVSINPVGLKTIFKDVYQKQNK